MTTMTVALATSTPTSTTVVATSTSTSPAANRRITSSFSSGGSRPCSTSTRSPASGPSAQHRRDVERPRRPAAAPASPRRPAPSSPPADGSSVVGDVAADPRADDVRLVARRRPPRGPAARRGRGSAASPRPARRAMAIGDRPAGSSVSVETSRSPNTVIATVRGIGVAVMTRTCGGPSALAAQRVALLDAEPVLLVDDDQPEVGEVDGVLDQRVGADDDAGVAADDRRAARARRAAVPCEPVSSATRVPMSVAAEQPALGQRAEHRGDRPVVLLGEHLGRGEQRRLARRRRRRRASRAARPRSCRSRPRPAAAGASGARGPGRRRSRRRPPAARR